jgi:hypothetical protein
MVCHAALITDVTGGGGAIATKRSTIPGRPPANVFDHVWGMMPLNLHQGPVRAPADQSIPRCPFQHPTNRAFRFSLMPRPPAAICAPGVAKAWGGMSTRSFPLDDDGVGLRPSPRSHPCSFANTEGPGLEEWGLASIRGGPEHEQDADRIIRLRGDIAQDFSPTTLPGFSPVRSTRRHKGFGLRPAVSRVPSWRPQP